MDHFNQRAPEHINLLALNASFTSTLRDIPHFFTTTNTYSLDSIPAFFLACHFYRLWFYYPTRTAVCLTSPQSQKATLATIGCLGPTVDSEFRQYAWVQWDSARQCMHKVPYCVADSSTDANREKMMGACDKNTTFEILDRYKSLGGNFIDLANNYQAGQSETWVGEWLAGRNCRGWIPK